MEAADLQPNFASNSNFQLVKSSDNLKNRSCYAFLMQFIVYNNGFAMPGYLEFAVTNNGPLRSGVFFYVAMHLRR
jgi:hypothetical protein